MSAATAHASTTALSNPKQNRYSLLARIASRSRPVAAQTDIGTSASSASTAKMKRRA